MTKTAIRRKENLRERKLKKKKAKNGDVYEEVSIFITSYYCSENP
jgi:hypothetical protein